MAKQLSLLISAILAVFAWTQAAHAQSQRTFTGPRIQLHAGYDNSFVSSPAGGSEKLDDGIVYGGVAGYDFEMGIFIVGLEAHGEVSGIDRTQTSMFGTARISTGRDIGAGIRIGVPVGPRILAFVRGGYSNLKVNVENAGLVAFTDDGTMHGYRIGGGLEVNLTRSLFGSLEYRYADYEDGLVRHNALASLGWRF